ncbi:putative RNA helicase [Helianthus annuus]|uniref:RNA helicase n=1 Tax=Helianthus annuus TaxID=4232 RepID=A0A9K3I5Y3_HELAN|nr:putative RNA helicase [Helianthus annuus]KAJ0525949.1 putative RNA helicase [Helianthus annuus]KAJ0534231.1 putative RNA helicase [Helianthus annuus]KAJ0542344.1 putative RNA helicase [Helianthus annuus]KAJ0629441.1 putative RNA helicase [Helianthus annuus]
MLYVFSVYNVKLCLLIIFLICIVEKRLVEEVWKNDTLIIVGETGSGKTTQLSQYLYNGGFCQNGGIIGITQPRRVAVVTVAKRVAEERCVELGQQVGYSIRFEDVTSTSTRIKYMTDGLLLREALLDPKLSRYSVIVVDEAHERTVQTDVLLGCLKILDARGFSEYFGGAKAVHVMGWQFPVDILYTAQPETDCLDAALVTIFQIESIEGLVRENLKKLPEANQKLLIYPLFSSLPSEKQMKVFTPALVGFRKENTCDVILATNIAETSVTIPGVKYVIDPGLVKVRSYSPDSGIESLIVVKTSKAQALQRSGRAGREGPGKCYRLYPESRFEGLDDSTVPEIKRCNLSNVILKLSALGVDDIIGFDFMEKPDRMDVIRSLELLYLLGALTDEKKLSDPIGHQMAHLPLEPNDSKALILASQFDCLEEMLIVVSMLPVESIFYVPRDKLEESRTIIKSFSSPEGDDLTLVNVYRASIEFLEKNKTENGNEKAEKNLRKWCKDNFINNRSLKHARDIYNQLENVERMGLKISSCGDDMLPLRRCLAASYFLNAALKQPDGTYR